MVSPCGANSVKMGMRKTNQWCPQVLLFVRFTSSFWEFHMWFPG